MEDGKMEALIIVIVEQERKTGNFQIRALSMFVSRVLSRIPRAVSARGRTSLLLSASQHNQSSILSNHFHPLRDSPNKLVTSQVSLLHHSALNAFQRCGISSSASPEPTVNQSGKEHDSSETAKASGNTKVPDHTEGSGSGEAKTLDQTEESDSDSESMDELSRDELVKLVLEKETLLKNKQKDIEKAQDKILRSYAEVENIIDRNKRESEHLQKYAIQRFAKSLLDVADNLGRASTAVKDSFSKIDASKDTVGAVPLIKTLLEGVEMTDKQLTEVLRKFGVEKFDPTNEQFDPHRHNAQFQIPDGSKPPGTVAVVLKAGYMIHDRVLRAADVGITEAVDNNEAEGSKA
ncbi:hypothetical protein L1049_000478 [Liquidambar formosana]|uniref:GrpE protein homolog n=1 Tax=Liquidambar formosana TaxID=63359 RepID=A0AAP0NAM9_LIQFO